MNRPVQFISIFSACVATYLAAPAPCNAQDTTFTRDEGRFVEAIERRYRVGPEGSLKLEADIGSVRVDSWTNDEVDIRIEKRMKGRREERARSAFDEVEVVLTRQDNDVHIRIVDKKPPGYFGSRVSVGMFLRNRVSVEVEMRVPEFWALDLSTVDGGIEIENMKGPVTADAVDGDIEIDATDGHIRARTTDGDIEIRHTQGTVEASAVDGSIDIGHAAGDVTARTTDGDIEIHDTKGSVIAKTVDGNIETRSTKGVVDAGTLDGDIDLYGTEGNVKAQAVRGSIEVDIARKGLNSAGQDSDPSAADSDSDPRYHLETTEGDVTIHLPDDLAASIEAEGSSGGLLLSRLWRDEVGRVYSDFGLNKSEWGVFFYRQSEASGKINSGGDRIRLKTNSGNIYIKEK